MPSKLQTKKQVKKASLPFTSTNYYIFVAGLLIILIGYVCLSTPPVYGFMSMTVAPILLCLGYLVIIPAAILYRKKTLQEDLSSNLSTKGSS